MKSRQPLLQFLSRAGMELTWFYAWANFLTTSLLKKPFPLSELIVSFGLAAGVTTLSKGRGWRVFQILAIQAMGLTFAASRMVHGFYYSFLPFWSSDWLYSFFDSPRSPIDWIVLAFVLLFPIVFWSQGVFFIRRPSTYWVTTSRFDGGLSAFFLLLLIKFLLRPKGEIEVEDPLSYFLIFPFFIFSLLAIGLARDRSDAERDFLPGYRGIGAILGFLLMVFAFGSGLVLFFYAHLKLAAHTGYQILKTAAQPLGPILVRLLRAFFLSGINQPQGSGPTPDMGSGYSRLPTESSGWTELLEKILMWGIGIAIGLGGLIVAALILYFLWRWLLSRTPRTTNRQTPFQLIATYLRQWFRLLLFRWKAATHHLKGKVRAQEFYVALLYWGRRSGLSHFVSETPSEYGCRLKARFPTLKQEIEMIVEAFHQESYREVSLSERQQGLCHTAWRRLRSPLLWYPRIKSRLLGHSA